MANVISDKTFRVWVALHKQLEKYHGILQARESSLRDLQSFQQQNRELRALLNQYLASRINEELQIPPVHVI